MDVLPKTTLAGKLALQPRWDGGATRENTGAYPGVPGGNLRGRGGAGQIIPSDNYFWLAPGETREVVIERSPAAKLKVDGSSIRLCLECSF